MSRTTYEPPRNVFGDRAALGPGTFPLKLPLAERAAPRRASRHRLVWRLALGDVACAAVALAVGLGAYGALPPPLVTAVLPLAWVVALSVAGTYDRDVVCDGPDEFRRIVASAGVVLAGVGLYSWFWDQQVSHGLVALVLPVAVALTAGERAVQRHLLGRSRTHGRDSRTTLLVGSASAVAPMHARLRRQPGLGYRVVGSCLPPTEGARRALPGLPVLGGPTAVVDVVRRYDIQTVIAFPSDDLDAAAVRRLGWELDKTDADLLLAPGVTDIPGLPGPRPRVRSVGGLPLLDVARPRSKGPRRLAKAVFDRTAAGLLLVLVAPVMVAVAVAVKVDSAGPLFFRQQRVGRGGEEFSLLKFRTLRTDEPAAEDGPGDGSGLRTAERPGDARVTRVGRILRRSSLDELPRLLSVLTGQMSVVGPRPPLSSEVQEFGLDVRHRLSVKPGLTGWWLVSGPSELTWEEAVAVDVHHVENWSLAVDLLVLWRTCGAVVRGRVAH